MIKRHYVALLAGALLAGCRQTVECQSPPETLQFTLQTATGQNVVTAANADRVVVRYGQNGQFVRDLRVQPPFVLSYDMLNTARQQADTTRFFVLLANQPLGVIQLKTYVDTRPCQGWTRVRELRFNGQVVPFETLKPGYTLTVAP